MAISWGSVSGHLRSGISYSISPSSPSHSDTSVSVTWTYYVGSYNWGFSDNESAEASCDGWGGTTWNYTMSSPTGGTVTTKIGSRTQTYNIGYSTSTASAETHVVSSYTGSNASKSLTITLPARPVATPSNGEQPTAGSIGNTTATISWSSVSDNGGASVDQYQLQVADNSGFSSPAWNHTFNDTGSASDSVTGLTPNTHYYARVRAHNSAGWGDWTSATGCQFTTTGGTPDVPKGFVVGSYTQTQIKMAWRAANSNGGGTITYECQMSTSSSFTSPTTVSTTSLGATFGSLTANTTYYFRVRSSNSFGYSAYSGTVSQKTKPVPTYNDSGDFTTLMDNLASAVGDKLVHLGNATTRCHTAVISFTENTTVVFNMGTAISSHGKDAPTYLGNGTSDIQINYPGTYQIELAISFSEGTVPTSPGYIGVSIYVNGQSHVTPTLQKGGIYEKWPAPNGSATSAMRRTTITRYLDKGDTVGWSVFMNANNGGTTVTSQDSGGGLQAYARVCMVGF